MVTGDADGGWVGFFTDSRGQVADHDNQHLTDEQRAHAELLMRETAERRGRLQVRILVDVYENGEAVPQVQLAKGSTVDIRNRDEVNAAVSKAAAALRDWR
jgi:hypothetical protein